MILHGSAQSQLTGFLCTKALLSLCRLSLSPRRLQRTPERARCAFRHSRCFVSIGAVITDTDEVTQRADGMKPGAVFLFTVGETGYFRCEVDHGVLGKAIESRCSCGSDGQSVQLGWQFMPISQLKQYRPKHRAFAGLVGYEYDTWYATRKFCGRCGTHLVHDMVERMVRCPHCGAMEFPKLFPAVIVGIVDSERNKILVSRYANREYKRYALIAGFCEMGETVEETVHREVMEEVGLRVKNLRYYKSQPWPPSSSLLFGFFCELDGSTISSSTTTSLRVPSG